MSLPVGIIGGWSMPLSAARRGGTGSRIKPGDDMSLISNMLSIFKWLFVRLPLGFSVPFTAASLWWVLAGFRRLNDAVADFAAAAAGDRFRFELPGGIAPGLIAHLCAFFYRGILIRAL